MFSGRNHKSSKQVDNSKASESRCRWIPKLQRNLEFATTWDVGLLLFDMYQWLSYMRGYTSRKVGKGEDSIGGEVASRALSLQSENPWSRYLINAPQDCCFRYDWTLTGLLSPVNSFLRSWTNPPFLLCSKFPLCIPSFVRTCIRQYTAYNACAYDSTRHVHDSWSYGIFLGLLRVRRNHKLRYRHEFANTCVRVPG